jgi:hypothetical protein
VEHELVDRLPMTENVDFLGSYTSYKSGSATRSIKGPNTYKLSFQRVSEERISGQLASE